MTTQQAGSKAEAVFHEFLRLIFGSVSDISFKLYLAEDSAK